MAGQRIADVQSGGEGQPPKSSRTSFRALGTLGGALSPRGVMIAIPLLVGVVGVFLTLVGQEAMRASNIASTDARLAEQAQLVAQTLGDALHQADPLLDRVAEIARVHDPGQPFERVAHQLADLMRGRNGVTYVSISFTDGTFQGAYTDVDGVVRFQDSRVGAGITHARRYDLTGRDELALQREEQTAYDPRKRSFYRLAESTGRRAWTEPYPFFATHQTGVTRVAPVFINQGAIRTLHAVATVDFDVLGLSSQLGQHQLPGTRALLYATDGAVLAYASETASDTPFIRSEDRLLRPEDLNDPVISAFFANPLARHQSAVGDQTATTTQVQAGGAHYRIAIAPVSRDRELPWSMAYFASEERLMHDLAVYRTYSAVIAAAALLLSVVIAYLLALGITRARNEVASARADAEQARQAAQELGSYRLVERLGEGAMGAVWRAEHRLLARQAAIKLINPALLKGSGTPEVRTRFRREAEALASLRSRNTIELFDYGVAEDGTFFYVMELLDGMDLETLVERYGAQPYERVVPLLVQACNSLAEAHDRGLVHRDVKPANIYVCRAADEVDVVKVLDFGLVLNDQTPHAVSGIAALLEPHLDAAIAATVFDTRPSLSPSKLTQPGGLIGTPAFMPPEQIMGHPVDGRADLYALACVAVWLLSGQLLYPYVETTRLLVAHMREPVPDLDALLPSTVPPELRELLRQCLQKQPADRLSSVRELARRLRELAPGPGVWSEHRAHAWWDTHHPAAA